PSPLSHRAPTALQSKVVKRHNLNSEHSGSSPGRTTLRLGAAKSPRAAPPSARPGNHRPRLAGRAGGASDGRCRSGKTQGRCT
ncbi:unnamed protein product, partial [Gulo gulo]